MTTITANSKHEAFVKTVKWFIRPGVKHKFVFNYFDVTVYMINKASEGENFRINKAMAMAQLNGFKYNNDNNGNHSFSFNSEQIWQEVLGKPWE